MSVLICDRCGEITVDGRLCRCGATGCEVIDLADRRRRGMVLARGSLPVDPASRPGPKRANSG